MVSKNPHQPNSYLLFFNRFTFI